MASLAGAILGMACGQYIQMQLATRIAINPGSSLAGLPKVISITKFFCTIIVTNQKMQSLMNVALNLRLLGAHLGIPKIKSQVDSNSNRSDFLSLIK